MKENRINKDDLKLLNEFLGVFDYAIFNMDNELCFKKNVIVESDNKKTAFHLIVSYAYRIDDMRVYIESIKMGELDILYRKLKDKKECIFIMEFYRSHMTTCKNDLFKDEFLNELAKNALRNYLNENIGGI